MVKNFVFDTNVLLHDPNAVSAFKDNNIIIPIVVVEEMDHFKKDMTETGRNARYFSRVLDNLRVHGKLSKGVPTQSGGNLRVEIGLQQSDSIPTELLMSANDAKILSVALNLQKSEKEPVYLVTKDTNLRIKADALGVAVQDYDNDKISIKDQYTGVVKLKIDRDSMEKFRRDGKVSIDGTVLPPNCFVELEVEGEEKREFARNHQNNELTKLRTFSNDIWGILPKNVEQGFALELLTDDSVKLVTLTGFAGSGKTLLALAAGLLKVADERKYGRLLVSRPIFPMGKDVGFLPGNLEEKLTPWMQPIFDNMQLLMGGEKGQSYEELLKFNIIHIEPLTYIRGRTLPNQFFIVDEAQNLSPHEIKTIISRVGENTKIVLTGDPNQIDNPYLDQSSNGLSHVANRMKEEVLSGHVTLMKGERSRLAEVAATRL